MREENLHAAVHNNRALGCLSQTDHAVLNRHMTVPVADYPRNPFGFFWVVLEAELPQCNLVAQFHFGLTGLATDKTTTHKTQQK